MQKNSELISNDYCRLNENMHKERPCYGVGGSFWAGSIYTHACRINAKTILDYGAGKRTLENSLLNRKLTIKSYDPCIPEIAGRPDKADIVVCTDVLEHIEPDLIDNVLISDLT